MTRLITRFFVLASGKEPVKDWLLSLDRDDRRIIGEDIKTIEIGWPLGMPLVRKMDKGLWEIRSNLEKGIARVFFTVEAGEMVLLHGFVKKSQKTPEKDLQLAKRRLRAVKNG